MNTPPHSSPDSTPEPLEPETAKTDVSEIPQGSFEDSADSWEKARADLDGFLGEGDDEPTIFDQNIEEDADESDKYNQFEQEHAKYKANEAEIYAAGYVEPRGSRWPAILIFLLLVGGIGSTALYLKIRADAKEARRWAPIAMPDKIAFVPTDWGRETLAEKLKKSDKIRDVDAFVQSAKEVDLTNVLPGGYALPAVAGPRDLARIFKAGPTHEKAVFPPGFTGVQIVDRLRKEGFSGADQMEDLIYPKTGFSPYEGTLAPATYWMPIRADGKTLIAQMQEEFAGLVKKLPQPLPTVNGKTLTTREVVTIASLVERESNLKNEMPLVAGVIINRLQKPMRLQIDASVQYARIMADKEHKTRLYFEDYKFQSPFNTYLNDGLPPTPICNPGENALMAAARPAQTKALFYVYSPKLKKHYFSDDFDQHRNNVAKARRERDAIENARP